MRRGEGGGEGGGEGEREEGREGGIERERKTLSCGSHVIVNRVQSCGLPWNQ